MPASGPSAAPRRLFLECTETYSSGQNTGIQRVVRNIAQHAAPMGRQVGLDCRPVILRGGRFYEWDIANAPPAPHVPVAAQRLRSVLDRPWVRRAGKRLRKALYPRTLARALSSITFRSTAHAVSFRPGDVLMLLDASWNPALWPHLAECKSAGAQVGVVVYDLIPKQHPEFVNAEFAGLFDRWLTKMLDEADYFLAISDTVAADLLRHARTARPQQTWEADRFGSFRLGAALDFAHSEGPVRPSIRGLFLDDRKLSPYLTVGTLQPRKNHELLLDAFDQVWREYPEAQLCIAGKAGWLCDELLHRMRRHPQFGKSVFHFEDLTDTELAYCYARAKALLFPSFAEGFGLPIVEALQHGLPVFASDIPIHREVGSEFCSYFDPHASETLAALLRAYEHSGAPPATRQPGQYEILDWRGSCREFAAQCARLADRASSFRRAAA